MRGAQDHLDDAALLRAHTAGDPDAFAELVRRHRDRLWAVAVRTLGDREEAADAVQDALLSAYRSADRFRGDSAVTTWLHRIVVNSCLDRARRRQARPTVPLPVLELAARTGAAAAVTPDPDTSIMVWRALDQLPSEQRVALVLLDMHGYPVAEIAQILGVAEGTVKSRCARGRARLAVLLGHLRLDAPGRATPGRTGEPREGSLGRPNPREGSPGLPGNQAPPRHVGSPGTTDIAGAQGGGPPARGKPGGVS